MEDFEGESSASLLGIFLVYGTHRGRILYFLTRDTLGKNLLLPPWVWCSICLNFGESLLLPLWGWYLIHLRKNLLLPYWEFALDAWNIEEKSSTSLLRVIFDSFDPFSAFFTGDALLEMFEISRKSLLLPYWGWCLIGMRNKYSSSLSCHLIYIRN